MSASDHDVEITERVSEQPKLDAGKIKQARARDLGYRFLAGAATSIAAGLLTLAFGARTGGIFLAFPAILAASLTLIEEHEDSAETREDTRGAVIGGCALTLFAVLAAITLGLLNPAIALLLHRARGWEEPCLDISLHGSDSASTRHAHGGAEELALQASTMTSTMRDAAAIAAVTQALVAWLGERHHDRGERLAPADQPVAGGGAERRCRRQHPHQVRARSRLRAARASTAGTVHRPSPPPNPARRLPTGHRLRTLWLRRRGRTKNRQRPSPN